MSGGGQRIFPIRTVLARRFFCASGERRVNICEGTLTGYRFGMKCSLGGCSSCEDFKSNCDMERRSTQIFGLDINGEFGID